MKKLYQISSIILLIAFGCKNGQNELKYEIDSKPKISNLLYNKDSLILYDLISQNNEDYTVEQIDYRGIDYYNCYYDSTKGLSIIMSFGFMSGETFYINYENDSLRTNFRSWGCTSHESFRYQTIKQKLILNSDNFKELDSIIGYITYEGIQDIEHKIKELESYGTNSDWLKELKPKKAKVEGYLKLKIFNDQMEYSNEYDRSIIYRRNKFKIDIEDIMKYKYDSLNGSGMKISSIPNELKSLNSITILNLEANQLKNVDFKELSNLNDLQKIYLGWNGFIEFPKNLTTNKKLKYVHLKGNPIESLPIEELLNSNIEYINLKGSKLNRTDLKMLETKIKIDL